jgi:predicted enzyme related to lactoylglutathione lyase
MDWGEWIASFVDPDGNEFDLKQPLDPAAWRM